MPQQSRPARRTLILDPIHPRDYRELVITYSCEQCSHFDPVSQTCTIGYDAKNHLKSKQEENYARYGKVAFCRFLEID